MTRACFSRGRTMGGHATCRFGRVAGASHLVAVTLMAVAHSAWSACSVSADGVNFGSYDTFSRVDSDSAGNIAVTCDAGVAYAISLSSGGGTYATRSMSSGSNVLNYNLYTTAARNVVWGDGAGATVSVGGTGRGSVTNTAVYGRVPARQNVRAGSYADSIVVTVSF